MIGNVSYPVRRGADGKGSGNRDLAGGLPDCSYDFFDQCPHRMACAKCAFYVPKGSSAAQALEGRANLRRLLQEMRLTEDERAAVEDGVAAFERLLTKLADVPTPTGLAPRQIAGRGIIPLRPVSGPVEGKESGPGG